MAVDYTRRNVERTASLPPHTSSGGESRPHVGPWRIWEALLILAVFTGLQPLISLGIAGLVQPGLDPSLGGEGMGAQLALYVLPAVILISHGLSWLLLYLLATMRMEGFLHTMGLGKGVPTPYVLIFLGGMILPFLGALLSSVAPPPEDMQTIIHAFLDNGALAYALLFFFAVVLAPFLEEVLFRGVLYGALRRHGSFVFSALITTLLFTAVHWSTTGGYWPSLVLIAICGACLAYLRERFGPMLWAPILFHMGFNLTGMLVLAYGATL